MVVYHPCKNDENKSVRLIHPHVPTSLITWESRTMVATVVPGSFMPEELNDIEIRSVSNPLKSVGNWNELASGEGFFEPPFKVAEGKKAASGVVILEPDGRVWMVSPSNKFGGSENVFPKGQIDSPVLTLRANAIEEALEETGLRVSLVAFLCDSQRTTTTTRFYLAQRVEGNPADMGWESQAVHLVPWRRVPDMVSHPEDKAVFEALENFSSPVSDNRVILRAGPSSGLMAIVRIVNGFRDQYGYWPKRLFIDEDIALAVRGWTMNPLGWNMLARKIELLMMHGNNWVAEGRNGDRYSGDFGPFAPADGFRADVWIWGLELEKLLER